MSKRASPKAIGGFVVGAIALLVIGVLIFSSGRFLAERPTYVLFFEGAIGGLNVGAPVDFRGVKVGSVKSMFVQFDPRDMSLQIPVIIEMEGRVRIVDKVEVDPQTAMQEMIRRGLRAELQLQSMVTGQKKIELDFHPDTHPRILGIHEDYPEIPTVQSNIEKLARTIEDLPIDELFDELLETIQAIESVVNTPEVKGSIRTLERVLKDADKLVRKVDAQVDPLASGIKGTVKDTRKLVGNADKQLAILSSDIEKAVEQAQKLVQNVDGQVTALSSEIDVAVEDTQKLIRNTDSRVASLTSNIEKSSDETRVTLKQITNTFSTIEDMTQEDSPLIYNLTNALEELSAVARSLRTMADYLERHPEALLSGKEGGD